MPEENTVPKVRDVVMFNVTGDGKFSVDPDAKLAEGGFRLPKKPAGHTFQNVMDNRQVLQTVVCPDAGEDILQPVAFQMDIGTVLEPYADIGSNVLNGHCQIASKNTQPRHMVREEECPGLWLDRGLEPDIFHFNITYRCFGAADLQQRGNGADATDNGTRPFTAQEDI